MKRKALLLLAIASFVMQALPIKAWAGGLDEAQEATSGQPQIATDRGGKTRS